jgi:hypothetical protein
MVERMHQDFEEANRAALKAGQVDPSQLAYPFYSFVQRSAKPKGSPEQDKT